MQMCCARSTLPECKLPCLKYEREILQVFFKIMFAIMLVHILVMLAALLCLNHVMYRFGEGMMPQAYQLNMDSMTVIMDQYAV